MYIIFLWSVIQVGQLKMLAYKSSSETCYPVYEGSNLFTFVILNFELITLLIVVLSFFQVVFLPVTKYDQLLQKGNLWIIETAFGE